MPSITRVKICCIANPEEAALAIAHGASAVGLVSEMPSGPGVIDESEIARIASTLPPAIGSFLLTSKVDAQEIILQQRRCCTNTIQIVDALSSGTYAQMREALPGIALVQVIHVTGWASVDEACRIASQADGILLDSGNPSLAVKELGGTGRTHNWDISAAIAQKAAAPVFLAGGLNPHNVSEAIRHVQPFGVDICSGVRTRGHLDALKLSAFMDAVRAV